MDYRGRGGGARPQGEQRGENGRRGRGESTHKIGGKKPLERTKASEQENGQGVQTDEGPTKRECMDSEKNWRRRHWGVLHAECNGAARVRGHNTWYRGNRTVRTTVGRVWK